MSAPEHVPTSSRTARSYASPPRRAGSWTPDRPGELVGRQPEGERLGTPGPDQGYALVIVEQFRDRLQLADGEHASDALAAAAAIAMKRSGLMGRAPVVHDVTSALTVWGLLDGSAPAELVDLRRQMFEEVHLPHQYDALREVVDAVPTHVLSQPHGVIAAQYARDWRSCLDLNA
jgi:hypothetical protein